jgi:hypothetical protein
VSVDANELRVAPSLAISSAIQPLGESAAVIEAPLQDPIRSALPTSAYPAFIAAMRFIPYLFLLLATASAQTSVTKLLGQGVLRMVTGHAPVPAKDKAEILDATATLLTKHVTFRPDGTASAYYTQWGRHPVEWKKFVISHMSGQPITEADRLNGITKRYMVAFGCDAHRSWDTKNNTWGQWYASGNVTFPSGITFEWINGAWVTRVSPQLQYFTPGPGPSITEPKRAAKDADLPQGMTRGK